MHFVRVKDFVHQAQYLNHLANRAIAHATVGYPGVFDTLRMVAEEISVMRNDYASLAAREFHMCQVIGCTQPRFDACRHIDASPAQSESDE
jgi:hypothetical protein